VLDTRHEAYPDAPMVRRHDEVESELFEWAVSFSASLAAHLRDSGLMVQFLELTAPQLEPRAGGSDFLDGLARIALVRGGGPVNLSAPGSRDSLAGAPVFAVVPDADHSALEVMVEQRSGFTSAVAFVLASHALGVPDARTEAAASRLRDAGWLCVLVPQWMSVGDAWLALDEEASGRGHR
jgi:uncharacterized protein (DUF58 family)